MIWNSGRPAFQFFMSCGMSWSQHRVAVQQRSVPDREIATDHAAVTVDQAVAMP
jgi:hypothetical protein